MDRASIALVFLAVLIASQASAWEVTGQVVSVESSYMPIKIGFSLDPKPNECTGAALMDWKAHDSTARDRIVQADKTLDTLMLAWVYGLRVTAWGQGCIAEDVALVSDQRSPSSSLVPVAPPRKDWR